MVPHGILLVLKRVSDQKNDHITHHINAAYALVAMNVHVTVLSGIRISYRVIVGLWSMVSSTRQQGKTMGYNTIVLLQLYCYNPIAGATI